MVVNIRGNRALPCRRPELGNKSRSVLIAFANLHKRIPIGTGLATSFPSGYSFAQFRSDLQAGITVGIVAIPLAMALAIASGAPPEFGLYTSIVAGAVIAFTGGSPVNVSGPTAAFVIILLPVSHQFGMGGLLTAGILAGIILLLMGVFRLGRLIRYIPYPITTGFTAGIAIVLAILQLKDFLGLEVQFSSGHFLGQFTAILSATPTLHVNDLIVGLVTFTILWSWPFLRSRIPGHLVALAVASVAVWGTGLWFPEFHVATIGSRYEYINDGVISNNFGFIWPWNLPNAEGTPAGLSLDIIHLLLPAAFTIAMLGAIESLMCAVVADGMAGTRHNPDGELIGQGLGNIIAPFFSAIPATAAIARTATNIRTGGRTPISAVIHSIVIFLIVLAFSNLLAYVPMASLAALLMLVAWNMSDAREFIHIIRISPRSDVAVLLTCFFFTVIFDMVVAVGVGLVLAALLFIHRMAELTETELLDHREHNHLNGLPDHIAVYDIDGPLFFGAADKAISALHHYQRTVKVIILDMTDVPMIDITGMIALRELVKSLQKDGIMVVFANLSSRIKQKLERAGITPAPDRLAYCSNMQEARAIALAIKIPE